MNWRALALAAALAWGPAQADTLADARRAVDARQYTQALALFDQLLRAQPDNSDLLIETARVYGFADRHREAIATYQRVLAVAPQRRRDIVAALAWQTLWAGDAAAARPLFEQAEADAADARARADALRGQGEACATLGDVHCALRAYQQAAALQPQDRELRRRVATAWLWLDDYDQAEMAWRALLDEDPTDRRSRAGLARTLNNAGRHNEAVVAYRALDDGSDADVRLDHARALRWAGYDRQAYVLLDGRNDADAVFLRDWRARRETVPYVFGTLEFATDSDDLNVTSISAAAGTWLSPQWLGEIGDRFVRLDGLDGQVNGNRLFGTLRGVYGSAGDAPPGLWVPAISLGLNDYAGWTPVTGNASLRWLPADRWRFAADAGREIVETPMAVANRITVDAFSLGAEHRLPPRWTFAGALSNLRFSDDNVRNRITARIDYAWRFSRPRVAFGVEGAAFESSLPASFAAVPPPGTIAPHGYWNPKRYAEGRVFADIRHELPQWEWYGRIAYGWSTETDGDGNTSSGHPNLLEVGVVHDVGPGLRWRAFAGGSGSSFAVGNGGSGYWRRYVGVTLTAWF